MQATAWVTLATLLLNIWLLSNVGKARSAHKVPAPRMDGPEEFLSAYRVQANTVEQMVIFIPALWMCAYFLSDKWAAIGGAAWVIGRIVYALGYYQSPSKRSIGFLITFLASAALMIGTAYGLLMRSGI